jgi:hypothetical protein
VLRFQRTAWITVVFVGAWPAGAYAVTSDAGIPAALTTGLGVAALVMAAGLLVEMLSLRKIAEGSAVGDHLSYALLGVFALAASVLTGWVSKYVTDGLSVAQARLGADVLTMVAMAFFGVYFFRVRRAMSKFLKRLTGEEQLVVAVLEPDEDVE